ncbi:UNVERIFIED_CONTAM: hypothetical protein H355_013453 [Colinus virginianus]|nr:hypothetical protein H355_013453 [Colinus virginianus]
MGVNGVPAALQLLRSLPKVSLANLRPNPGSKKRSLFLAWLYVLVFVFIFLTSCRRQYHPLSLQRLQYLIDLGRVDPTQPIDLTQLTNARGVTVQPLKRDYGVQLVEEPIPKRMLPPEDLVRYYTDASNRGYLADPSKVAEARLELAKKYGYTLPDITKDELFKMLSTRKDPRQIFFGLAPGWIVNMADKKVLKPTDERLLKYYSS